VSEEGHRRPLAAAAGSAVAMAMGSAVGFLPGFIIVALRADLGLDYWEVGLLSTVNYGCTWLAMSPAARLTDRWGARRVVLVDMALVRCSGEGRTHRPAVRSPPASCSARSPVAVWCRVDPFRTGGPAR